MKLLNLALVILFSLMVSNLTAQIEFALEETPNENNPVKWSFSAKKIDEGKYEIILTADVEKGWCIYSQESDPNAGPVPTTVQLNTTNNASLLGSVEEIGNKKKEYDQLIGANLIKLYNRALFKQKMVVTKGPQAGINGQVTYMSCNEEGCLPPKEIKFKMKIKGKEK